MKRLMLVLLSFILFAGVLSGCSTADLGYLDMLYTVSMPQYTLSGHIDASLPQDFGMTLGIDYDGEVDISVPDDIKYDIRLSVSVNNAAPVDARIIINKHMYISSSCVGIYMDILNATSRHENFALVKEELKQNALSSVSYIEMPSFEDVKSYGNGDFVKAKDAYLEFIKNSFKDLNSNVIRKTENGYKLELNYKTLSELVYNIVAYTCDHKEEVYDGLIDYIDVFASDYIGEASGVDFTDTAEKLKNGREEFYEVIQELAEEMYNNSQNFYSAFSSAKGSEFSNEISKSEDDIYSQSMHMKFVSNGREKMDMSLETEVYEDEVVIPEVSGNIMSSAELSRNIVKAYNKVNPLVSVKFDWADWSDWARIYAYRKNDLNSALSYCDKFPIPPLYGDAAMFVDGALYVPLRSIAEGFNEEVVWDEEQQAACIVRGDELIAMPGIEINSLQEITFDWLPNQITSPTMYVPVRLFEKFGYRVEYEYNQYSRNLVTLSAE